MANKKNFMKSFLDNDFLLQTETAKQLYHNHAAHMPIIDYHNHLPSQQIAEDYQFKTITEVWLKGDHYKWRAMRANGVNENDITGNTDDKTKFLRWASTVPYTMRNPLYHWTHLELQRYFGITDLLDETSAEKIYAESNRLLQTKEYSVKNLLHKMNVKTLCTTDDPCDTLEHHQKIKQDGFEIKVLPTFRPDAAIAIENVSKWNEWVNKLSHLTGISTFNFAGLIDALKKRHDFFAEMGCRLSDHGLETMYAADYNDAQIEEYYDQLRRGDDLFEEEANQFKSAVLYQLALLDHEKNWTAQWHIGAIRNNNSALLKLLGADAGVDSIGDFSSARNMNLFFDKLNSTNQLSKTIIYNLNPADNELFAALIGNFQDGSVAGKMQYGSSWWFLDQKDGMEKQINALGNMGLLSRFIGMLTDSRSFLSYPRHEYFRRILCNILGNDVEEGLLPATEIPRIGKMVEDICYNNAKAYFEF
jgi:glucuronate isomerase